MAIHRIAVRGYIDIDTKEKLTTQDGTTIDIEEGGPYGHQLTSAAFEALSVELDEHYNLQGFSAAYAGPVPEEAIGVEITEEDRDSMVSDGVRTRSVEEAAGDSAVTVTDND